ncbi:hypothetical protein HNR53_003350 [Bacillus benzoevorans]|uniref:Uncharacterized protein n=1 Tax=Bacillus benzoevorans TaxID=1456 RepID=A0A7X0HW31_9BACI|nr:hypothetical protein [Bacillus benzoevorans]
MLLLSIKIDRPLHNDSCTVHYNLRKFDLVISKMNTPFTLQSHVQSDSFPLIE